MKRFYSVIIFILAVGLLSFSAMAQDVSKLKFPKLNEVKIPDIDKVTLDNGMKLYLLEDHSLPVFRVNVRINCGSYLEPAEKIGLASMCGTVMRTGGTSKMTGDEIDELLESFGGSVETSIDVAEGSASVNVLSDYTDTGLEVLADILRNPVFDQDKIDLAKVQMRSSISRRNDDIGDLTRREFKMEIYGKDSPYARVPEYTTVNNISREDLVEYHNAYIRPNNIQMAIWGDFNRDEIINKIKQYFGDWQKSPVEVPAPPKVEYNWRNKVYYAEKKDAAQSYVRVGHLGGLVTDPDYPTTLVMNSVLGGGFGSRITDNVRTKLGLAYSAGGRYISDFAYPGYFFVVASTAPDNTVQAAEEIIKQVKSMHTDPPTEEEMKKGKDGYLNSFVFNFDSKSEVLNRMMTYDFYGLPEDFLQQEKEGVEKVTPEAVMEIAKKSLRPDDMIVVVVGDKEKFDKPLTELGMGEPEFIDISIPPAENKHELEITPENIAKGSEILKQTVMAHGGLKNFKNIKSTYAKGTLTIVTPQGEFPISFESSDILPNKSCAVYSIMGRTIYDVTNVDKGWKTDQASGEIIPKTAEDLAKEAEDRARNTIMIFQEVENPSYKPVFDGSDEIEGTKVEYVTLVDEQNEPICRFGVKADNHQLFCKSYWGETMLGEGTIEDRYAEFKTVNQVTLPMVNIRYLEGQNIGKITFNEYNINQDFAPETFEKPTL